MDFAWMNYHYSRFPMSKFFNKVTETPFNKIELFLAAPHLNVFDYPLRKLLEMDREIQKRKLEIICVTPENCVYPINFSLQDEDMRDSSLRYYQRTVDTAEFLGAKRVQLCLGYGYFDQSAFDAWNYAKNSLSQIAEYAKRKGITLIVEELKETTSNVVNSSAQLARMICELNYDNVVGMMDIDQMAVFGETPDDYFAALGSKLQHIHFNDSGHTAPGDGTLPMKEYYDRIVANNYTGTCSFEICDRRYNIDPDAALDRTIEWFKTNTGIFK